MGQYIRPSDKLEYTPSGEDVVSGDIRQHPCGLAGIIQRDAADGVLTSMTIHGVVKHSKEPGLTMHAGHAAYFDESNDYFTDATTSGGYWAGIIFEDAAGSDTEVLVILNEILGP